MKTVVWLVAALSLSTAYAAEHDVGQKDKKFTVAEVNAKVGDVIKFTNLDPFFHNVFSISDALLFDLGSYPQGEFRTVTLEEEGVVEVECAIHPEMRMVINVSQ